MPLPRPAARPHANLGRLQVVALTRLCLFGLVVATPLLAGAMAHALTLGFLP